LDYRRPKDRDLFRKVMKVVDIENE
jgi:hypothetical protein